MNKLLKLFMVIALVISSASCQDTGEVSADKPAPRLISIVPQTVWNGCTAIISGTGFSNVIEENTVTVDGIVVPVNAATSNRLTITMPDHEIGKARIAVSVGNTAADTELETTYAELPEIVSKVTGISPVKGFAGDVITISGENFSNVTSENIVTFGGIEAKIQSVTTNTIKVVAPEHAKGAVDVQIISGGKTMKAPSQFTYMIFAITSNYPVKGAAGDKVTITGDGFSTVAEENIVMIGTEVAVVESSTETSLVVVMPDNSEGKYEFSITVGGKTIKGGYFEYGGSWRFETLITGYSKVQGMALAADGSFWVTRREGKAHGIYRFNPNGNTFVLVKESKSDTASDTDLLAGSFPWGADVAKDGRLYFAAKGTAKVLMSDSQGNISQYTIQDLTMSNPMKVLVADEGYIYVLCRAKQSKIYKVKDNQIVNTWTMPTTATYGYETMCFNSDETKIFVFGHDSGDIQLIDLGNESMVRIAGTGTPHSSAANYTDGTPGDPLSVTVRQASGAICAADGTIYFTDTLGKTIRIFKPDANGDYSKGTIETILGVPYDSTVLPYPNDIALAADGKTLYYLDNGGKICKIYYK
jgi:hypothetical protein